MESRHCAEEGGVVRGVSYCTIFLPSVGEILVLILRVPGVFTNKMDTHRRITSDGWLRPLGMGVVSVLVTYLS